MIRSVIITQKYFWLICFVNLLIENALIIKQHDTLLVYLDESPKTTEKIILFTLIVFNSTLQQQIIAAQ